MSDQSARRSSSTPPSPTPVPAPEDTELAEALLEYAQYIAALTQGRPLTAYQQEGLPWSEPISALVSRLRSQVERMKAEQEAIGLLLTLTPEEARRLLNPRANVDDIVEKLRRLSSDSEIGDTE